MSMGMTFGADTYAAEKKAVKKTEKKIHAPKNTPTPLSPSAKAATSTAPQTSTAPGNTVISPQLNSTGGFYGNFDFLNRRTFGQNGLHSLALFGTAGYTFARSFNLTVTGEFDHVFTKYYDRDRNTTLGDTTVSL